MTDGKTNEGIDIQGALRAAGIGFWAHNLRDGTVEWDASAVDLMGCPAPKTEAELHEMIHPDDRVDFRQLAANAAPGETLTLEFRVVHGAEVRWMRKVFTVERSGGAPIKTHGAVFDITARKRLDAELVEIHKNEALARLSANAARDFDNLITVILGSTELMGGEDLSEPTRQLLETIRAAAEQASELTRGMLLFGERAEARPVRTEVGGLLGSATPLLRQGLGRQHVLNIEVLSTPLYVYIDPAQLRLMLLNLVVNARHAMPTGGRVTITLNKTQVSHGNGTDLQPGKYVSLVVRDEGVGIAEDALPMIFEPFYTTRQPGEGAGMGLAAVRGIVRAAGGAIHASSSPNAGTKFEILLPLRAQPHVEDSSTPDEVDLTLGQRESVLFVDDDPMIQRVFKSVLGEFGFEVDAYGSALDALHALEHERYDIVVSDVVMPEMSGIELADAVSERWPQMPLVLLSGKEDEDGRYEYLMKPIRPSGLAMKIRQMLDRARGRAT